MFFKGCWVGAQQASKPIRPPKTVSSPVVSTELNAVQSTEYLGGKKKGKNKSKKYDNQQVDKIQNLDTDSKNKRKEKFPCLICGGDHFTKKCPHREEVSKILKNSPTPKIIRNPFLAQQQLIYHQSLHGPSSSSIDEVKKMSSE